MRMYETVLLALAAALLASPPLVAPALAMPRHGATSTTDAAENAPVAPSTQALVTRAAIDNMFAVKAAKLVERKGAPRAERHLARRVILDDSKMEDRLAQLVTSGMVKAHLPVQVDPAQQHKLNRLTQLSGQRFAAMYARLQQNGRQETIAMIRAYVQAGSNHPLRRWARNSLPVLQAHQRLAKTLH